MVLQTGVEPACLSARASKTRMSANSITGAKVGADRRSRTFNSIMSQTSQACVFTISPYPQSGATTGNRTQLPVLPRPYITIYVLAAKWGKRPDLNRHVVPYEDTALPVEPRFHYNLSKLVVSEGLEPPVFVYLGKSQSYSPL